MRIALVNQPWNAWPPRGGTSIAQWTEEVAKRLVRTESVVVFGGRTKARAEAHGGRIPFRPAGSEAPPPSLLQRVLSPLGLWPEDAGPAFEDDAFHLDYAVDVAEAVRHEGFDVVHVHNLTQFVPVIRARNPDVRIVLHMHCEWLAQLDAELLQPRLEAADAVVGCSSYVTEQARRRFPEIADRCHVLWNGVNLEAFRPDPARAEEAGATVLFVGRLSPEKGLHVLVDAFRALARRVPSARLRIVGPPSPTPREMLVDVSRDPVVQALRRFYPGPYRAALLERLPGPLRQRVAFVGVVPHRALPAEYQGAAVLVSPSLAEAFGRAVVEALACGVPVVASRVGGMPELLEGSGAGIVVPRDDPAALEEALVQLLGDEEMRRRMGARGCSHAERFGWDDVTQETVALYRSVSER